MLTDIKIHVNNSILTNTLWCMVYN